MPQDMSAGQLDPANALDVVVTAITQEADGILSFDLRAPDDAPLPAWRAGAHIDVCLPNGMTRQYSLCGAPDDRTSWRIGVLREIDGRGGSAFLHDGLAAGDSLRVSHPRNHFGLIDADRYLFVAGGIGITPILPMLAEVQRRGKPFTLLYGGRSRQTMAFVSELAQFGDNVILAPQDEVGMPDIAGFLADPAPGTLAYVCGPEPLVDAVEAFCADWPIGRLHRERFAPKTKPAIEPGGFEVELSQSGRRLYVPPEESLLSVLQDAGCDIDNSCTAGICGTCLVKVLAGTPDHQDDVLSDVERASGEVMLVCVSRAASDLLVLDL